MKALHEIHSLACLEQQTINMKKLKFKDRNFLYRVSTYDAGHDCTGYETTFYDATPKITKRKKYFLFGDMIEVEDHTMLFTIYTNIEDPHQTKEKITEKIAEKVVILKRQEEIDRGDIV